MLADGTVIWGRGFGAEGEAVGEVCFNTAMTGYQEIMTDPSYAAQIVTFTFPHIGNVGANYEDLEADNPVRAGLRRARGRDRAEQFPRRRRASSTGCSSNGRIGLSGVDTRALTRRIRTDGAPNGVIAHRRRRASSTSPRCWPRRADWPGLEGMDLAKEVSCRADAPLGRRPLDARARAMRERAARRGAARTSSRSITARSATSSATSSRPARG